MSDTDIQTRCLCCRKRLRQKIFNAKNSKNLNDSKAIKTEKNNSATFKTEDSSKNNQIVHKTSELESSLSNDIKKLDHDNHSLNEADKKSDCNDENNNNQTPDSVMQNSTINNEISNKIIISEILSKNQSSREEIVNRAKKFDTNDLRIYSIQNVMDLNFSLLSVPTIYTPEGEIEKIFDSYSKSLSIVYDLKVFREDNYTSTLKFDPNLDIAKICCLVLLKINKEIGKERYLDREQTPPSTPESIYKHCDESSNRIMFTPIELENYFWELNYSLGVFEGRKDMFLMRVLSNGSITMDKLAIDLETTEIWFFPVDTQNAPLIRPTNLKPLKVPITENFSVHPGVNCKNFKLLYTNAKIGETIPLPDFCLYITNRNENLDYDDIEDSYGDSQTDLKKFTYTLGLICTSHYQRNELLFLIRTWIKIHQRCKPNILHCPSYLIQEDLLQNLR